MILLTAVFFCCRYTAALLCQSRVFTESLCRTQNGVLSVCQSYTPCSFLSRENPEKAETIINISLPKNLPPGVCQILVYHISWLKSADLACKLEETRL